MSAAAGDLYRCTCGHPRVDHFDDGFCGNRPSPAYARCACLRFTPVTDPADELIAELTRDGHTAAAIAAALRISTRTVHRSRRRAGIARPAAVPLSAAELARAAELLDDGCSYGEVARSLGRSSRRAIAKHFPGRGWTQRHGGRIGGLNSAQTRRKSTWEGAHVHRTSLAGNSAYRQHQCIDCRTRPQSAGRPRCEDCHRDYLGLRPTGVTP